MNHRLASEADKMVTPESINLGGSQTKSVEGRKAANTSKTLDKILSQASVCYKPGLPHRPRMA